MLPNHNYLYQLPLQFFNLSNQTNSLYTTQNHHSNTHFHNTPFLQSPLYSSNITNPPYFYNYFTSEIPYNCPNTQIKPELKIQSKSNTQTSIEKIPQREKNQIYEKNQTQKNITKGCICAKTGCVKEYCRCFKNGKACIQQCCCHQCRNLFDRKLEGIKRFKNTKNTKCNCKKSKCSNKYCDCLVAGVGCGKDCNCTDCTND